MNIKSNLGLIAEEPVGLDDDALGFGAYARTLADAARESTQPLTIGVFGEWGTGKSSLMRMVAESLREHDKIVPIECNAWQYQHEAQPLFPLVASVIRSFDDHRSKPRTALDAVLNFIQRAVEEVESETSPEWHITEVCAAPVDMPDRLDDLLDQSQYAKAFQLLSEIDVPQGWRFVVFVDDLDRCSPEKAVRLLESIKLVLNQPGFVFVLGVSRAVIEEHLEHLYKKVLGVENFSGRSYLEKLVQLPFPIPPHRDRINDFMKGLANKIKEPELLELLQMLAPIFENNPRALVRVVNNLIIDRSINKHNQVDVPIGMFAVSRALQHRWRLVHGMLELADDELTASVVQWKQGEVPDPNDPSSVLSEQQKTLAGAMRESSALTSLLHSTAGINWLSDKTSRERAAQFVRKHKRESKQVPEKTDIYDAYISYSQADEKIAGDIMQVFLEKGLSVFYRPVSVLPGEKSQESMEAALQSSRALLYLVGETTIESSFQGQEALIMLDRIESEDPPLIVPVILPGVDSNLLADKLPRMAQFHRVDLRSEEPPYELATKQILSALQKHQKKFGSKS